jgi:OFA family oxalate/formate antiporter-like MFS transporter
MTSVNDVRHRRGRILVAGFCMQLALGAVYGWSVFLNPLREAFGASRLEVSLVFTITLVMLGITAGFGGYLQSRFGPRVIAMAAGILYGGGVVLSSFASTLPMLYLTYGVIGGIGLGFGYIVPLTVLTAWFPERRGQVTGLAVAGFGLGALIMSPIATHLITAIGVSNTLLSLGLIDLVVVVVAAQFLVKAPEGFVPAGWAPCEGRPDETSSATLAEALRSSQWYLLWVILSVNVTAGAALISVAAPLAQELSKVGPRSGAIAVSVIALFNGIGRLFWGTVSDWIGRPRTFVAIFLLQVLAFALIASTDSFALMLLPFALVALCYGGGFGTMPAFAADLFGVRNAGMIYGTMLTAWSAGAVAGPMLISTMPYRPALSCIAVLLAVASAIPLAVSSPMVRQSRQSQLSAVIMAGQKRRQKPAST